MRATGSTPSRWEWGILVVLALAQGALSAAPAIAQAPSPSEHLGMEIGADRTLADYRQIRDYFGALAEASPRVAVDTLGETTLGEEMILATISSEANLANLDRIKEIAARLADPRGLSAAAASALIEEGRAVLLVICNIHASEIGSSQMAMEWAHALATARDPETRRRLEEVVVLLVPSANPDGQIMEVEWYREWVGTEYEGVELPWIYHHYVGHDNNRDWFMLTQAETRLLNRAMYHEWFPQVVVDEHQMGSRGPRIFVPPFANPVDPDLHPLIFREIDGIGTNMALRLEQAGKAGVIYGYQYDAYWIGGTRNTPWWKNVTGLLTEIASVDLATPIRLDPTELAGERKGLAEYGPRVNHPNPWPGGWWRLRDILDYGRIVSDAALEWVADHREDVLANQLARARAAVAGGAGAAYRFSGGEDPPAARALADLMAEHGVEVRETPEGDFWIPLAQPYRLLVEELLEPQRYPEIRPAPGDDPYRPYDVSAWTLPLLLGVEVERTALPGDLAGERVAPPSTRPDPPAPALPEADWYALDRRAAETSRVLAAALDGGGRARLEPAGDTAWVDAAGARAAAGVAARAAVTLAAAPAPPASARSLRPVRVATYQPWTASMDEGWTRWLLETHGFGVTPLHDEDIRSGGGLEELDALILPDLDRHVIETGEPEREDDDIRYRRRPPPAYRGGLGDDGAAAVRRFVERGGTLIAFDSSTDWVLRTFDLPLRNALADDGDFASPGALVRVEVAADHPVTAGLPDRLPVFLDSDRAFETRPPGPEMERWVLARYPTDSRDALLSGWIEGEESLERRAALVATTYGEGKIVLFGFRPQFRGQTRATFPLLFNALWWAAE